MVQLKPSRTVAAAAIAAGLLFGATSCATPQTLDPYTPAEGVNYDLQVPNSLALKARNVLIVSQKEGEGTLSGALVSPEADKLTKVEGTVLDKNSAPAGELKATTAGLELKPNQMVVLTQGGTPIKVTGDKLTPGYSAKVAMTFEKAGVLTMTVPVVDANKADYKTMSPAGGQ